MKGILPMTSKLNPGPDPDDNEGQDDNYDPFDPASHKVGKASDYSQGELSLISVRKPRPREYFRSHPDPAYRRDVDLFERKGKETELYIIHRRVIHLFEDELIPVRLITSINKLGSVFLCPIRIWGDENERFSRLFTTAMKVVTKSETAWTRRQYNQDNGGYEGKFAKGDLGEPAWPTSTFDELFRIAFEGKLIDNDQHAVVKELEGEM
jgi:hypothetical protein